MDNLSLAKIGRLLSAKRNTEAEQLCLAQCRMNPTNAANWSTLASVRQRQGNLRGAISACEKVVELQQNNPAAHYNLAVARYQSAMPDKALPAVQAALKLNNRHSDAWLLLGMIQEQLHHRTEAVQAYQMATRINGKHFLARFNLARVQYDTGNFPAALDSYNIATSLEPSHIPALCNKALTLIALHNPREASRQLEPLLQQYPKSTELQLVSAQALASAGLYEKAVTGYGRALQLSPDLPTARLGMATSLEKLGRKEEAYRAMHPLLEGSEPPVNAITLYASICSKREDRQIALQKIEQALSRKGLSVLQQRELNYAAASLLDRLKQYDAAFEYARRANWTYYSSKITDNIKTYVSNIKKLYLEKRGTAISWSEPHAQRPVFVVGMPRSGTSLVEQILSQHPMVCGGGELPYIHEYAQCIGGAERSGTPYPAWIEKLDCSRLNSMRADYRTHLVDIGQGHPLVTDKMPHNFLFLGLINILFPDATIIHCSRNPFDTCISCHFQYFGGSNHYAHTLSTLGHHYAQYLRLMRFWRDTARIPVYDICYEDLVRHPATETRRLLEYCGLEWHEQCLRFYESSRPTRTASYDQTRRPLYTSSVGRWRHYVGHLDDLFEELSEL